LFGTFAVSLPFVNYGGVLADDDASARALLDAAVGLCRTWRATHLELRHARQQFPELRARRHKVAMTLPLLKTPEAQWQTLDRKIRNQVRKAEKSGITVTIGGLEDLPAFYGVFSRNMRDLGTPVYPIGMFREMLSTFPETTRLFTARHEGRPVAVAIAHWFRGTFEVPSASSLRECRALCPNILLYWEMMRFALASGAQVFDFGRSTLGEGTFHFKRQWGAEPRELVWEYWTASSSSLPDLSPANPKYGKAIAVWQRLPLFLTNLLGPRIVRHLP
jgi:FemAB-related protein (PEP-CTERM system-associated)